MNTFKEISAKDFSMNPFSLKDDWMLITASKDGKTNAMTANWGGFGYMWHKEVVYVVIRPQRYTKEFVDASESFSLCFFEKGFKKELNYLGSVSGRNENKIEKSGLNILDENGIPYFEESKLVIFVKKLYVQPTGAEFFLDKEIVEKWYPYADHHILYIGEVTKILQK